MSTAVLQRLFPLLSLCSKEGGTKAAAAQGPMCPPSPSVNGRGGKKGRRRWLSSAELCQCLIFPHPPSSSYSSSYSYSSSSSYYYYYYSSYSSSYSSSSYYYYYYSCSTSSPILQNLSQPKRKTVFRKLGSWQLDKFGIQNPMYVAIAGNKNP